ncbi:MAG: antibiotic ABC transporter ATP-binding protein [Crocinitomicaceae bacterium]|nr:antibiotic ABC transporter ATP-binding protein [Crocinitomicaceae bacterium]
MKNLLRIAKITLQFKKTLLLNLLFNILGMVFSLFSFAMIIPLLRVIFNAEESIQALANENPGEFVWTKESIVDHFNYLLSNYAIMEGRYQTLIMICVFLVSMVFLKNLFTFLSTFFLSDLIQSSVLDFRNRLFKKVLYLPMSFYTEERKGDLLSRFSVDLKEIELSVKATTNAIFKDPFYIVGYFLTLFVISYKLTLFIIIFLPIAGFVISRISSGLKKRSKLGQENVGNMLSMTEESLYGLRIIKSFNAQQFILERFKAQSGYLYRLMLGVNRRVFMASPVSEFLGVVATAGVLLYGGRLVLGNEILPDVFIGYLILFSQLISPFKSISKAIYDSSQGIAALNRVDAVLNEEEKIVDSPNALEKLSFKNEISFENIHFKYDEQEILNNISFQIPHGETVALVGHSGAGKTTLADLLIRLHDVSSGQITIDGHNIKNINSSALRSLMGVVSQESILFNDNVYNNIAFGDSDVNEEKVIEAAKMANAHEFIIALENGYKTIIGDGGNKLSGGQKQRISIARALYKNPQILILDEATSSLDTASEKAVQQALDRLMQNRTSLVIAHRLSTIKNAQKIIVLDKGKIVEMGSHDELIKQNNFYKRFIDLQSLK